MKFLFISIVSVAFLGAIVACKQPMGGSASSTDNFKKVYNLAQMNGDYGVMANCIYNILLADSNALGWKDSLIKNLSERGLYERAHVLAARRIAKEPNNKTLLTVEGMYARAAGKGPEAMIYYRRLYALTNEPSDGYQLAVVYFALQKVDSCDLIANKVMTDPKLDTKTIEVESGYNGQTQKVPARAVLLNMKGVLARAKGDNKTAQMLIGQALQLYPDFILAQQQMQALQGGGKN